MITITTTMFLLCLVPYETTMDHQKIKIVIVVFQRERKYEQYKHNKD